MPLLNLPNEIILLIADGLGLERDINALAQTNRRLFSLLDTYLYRFNIKQFKRHPGRQALRWAVDHGQEATARKWLAQKSSSQTKNKSFWAAMLCTAAFYGYRDMVELLLDNGADVNGDYSKSGTALQVAARKGHKEIVLLLLDRGAVINKPGRYCRNVIDAAREEGQVQIVELLRERAPHATWKGPRHIE